MNMKWGLVIQGPTISFGQGPNNAENGFSAISTIEQNIKYFSPYVCHIVISTWENSGLTFKNIDTSKTVLIENKIPKGPDFDNRRKQFITTLEGCKFLSLNSDATHILKIRTDQLVDPKIIEWLKAFFKNSNNINEKNNNFQENFLVFSDSLSNNPFYLGDFIFAGTKNDLISFCEANVDFLSKNLHPSIGTDYILKYFSLKDVQFWKSFYKYIPLLFQISNKRNKASQQYWRKISDNYVSVIPSEFFETIIWRGKSMYDVLPDYKNKFTFYDDWFKTKNNNITFDLKTKKSFKYLFPTSETLFRAKYEYKLYWKKLLKFYYKKK